MFKKNDVILFQGDSITDCGRDRNDEFGIGGGYPNLIKSRIMCDYPAKGFTVYNRGISGNRIVDLFARWQEDCINLKPDVISILIGVNDVWHEIGNQQGVDAEKFSFVYHLIINETKKKLPHAKIIICEPFYLPAGATLNQPEVWKREVALRQEAAKEVAEKHNLTFVPLQAKLTAACAKAPESYWLKDGVHPTNAGHMLIADEWMQAASAQ